MDSTTEWYVNLEGTNARGGVPAAIERALQQGGSDFDWKMLRLMDHAENEAEAHRDFWKRVHFFRDRHTPETENPFLR